MWEEKKCISGKAISVSVDFGGALAAGAVAVYGFGYADGVAPDTARSIGTWSAVFAGLFVLSGLYGIEAPACRDRPAANAAPDEGAQELTPAIDELLEAAPATDEAGGFDSSEFVDSPDPVDNAPVEQNDTSGTDIR